MKLKIRISERKDHFVSTITKDQRDGTKIKEGVRLEIAKKFKEYELIGIASASKSRSNKAVGNSIPDMEYNDYKFSGTVNNKYGSATLQHEIHRRDVHTKRNGSTVIDNTTNQDLTTAMLVLDAENIIGVEGLTVFFKYSFGHNDNSVDRDRINNLEAAFEYQF